MAFGATLGSVCHFNLSTPQISSVHRCRPSPIIASCDQELRAVPRSERPSLALLLSSRLAFNILLLNTQLIHHHRPPVPLTV